jgi:uncharacterized protein YecE (DUF72 family)
LKKWLQRVQSWAGGKEPVDLPRVSPVPKTTAPRRDVFLYFINGAKERAPAAAQKLISLLNE